MTNPMKPMKRQRPPQIRLYADEVMVDLFAGGGGASTGIELATGMSPVLAINHDREALAMHKVNHPDTIHLREDVRDVNPRKRPELKGKRIGLLWASPDCTFHSKARGGKPFRDRNRARRIRGLIGIVLKWATLPAKQRPRLIFIENVEEIEFWCPLGPDGRPDPAKRGASFRRWVSRLRNLGYAVEWRQLVTCDYGDPTKRKRLFIIARCDGQPIVWPEPTHGPGRQFPYRTAAEHIDFDLPVPSIFLNKREAKAWAKRHGTGNPQRPLAPATLRRVARGVDRFVLNSADPFIIPVTHPRDARVHSIHEPLRTITSSERGEFAVVTPFLSKFHGERRDGDARGQRLDLPLNTLDTSNRFGLVAPLLIKNMTNNAPDRVDAPIDTILTGNHQYLAAATLINTRNGERKGQAPRVMDIQEPFNTITAQGSQGALVAAFLAKHNGNDTGHDATGQPLTKPVDTLTTKNSKAIVTSHLVSLRGGHKDHNVTGQELSEPIGTLTAGGTHKAEVRVTLIPKGELAPEFADRAVQTCAFLVKYFGTGVARPIDGPLGTLTTKDRIGLVTVALVNVGGDDYVLADIGMRMLTPAELFRCQGFPPSYRIDQGICPHTEEPIRFTKKAQTRLVGNSVPPNTAAAIVAANLAERTAPARRTA